LWLSFTMKGMLWAQRRERLPRTPRVEATALQPPSTARRTMFSGSKYSGTGGEGRGAGVLDPLVHRQDGQVAGAAQAAVAVEVLEAAQHLEKPRGAVAVTPDAVHEIRAR
jgi:hypothetical protein